MSAAASERIRRLNDAFRAAGPYAGGWMITAGVHALGPVTVHWAVSRVQAFENFTHDNDPYGEHDFGSFVLSGETLFWKIDYYAPDLLQGSEDPGNPAVTRRILTLMLASEY